MNDLQNKVVAHMMHHDAFSKWLDIKIIDIKEGYAKIKMTIRKEMVNGFLVVHGGVVFSLADSAFAFACNNQNNQQVALFKGTCFRTGKNLV
jgi:acyl-CoA thioesterase